jgi:lysophospholipase L1-like esterase
MCDPDPGFGERWRGWADRLAQELAVRADEAGERFGYANLAIRGKLLPQIIEEQVESALELAPDLVSLIGGGNDVLRPRADVDGLTERLEAAVVRLREAGCTVLLATAYDARTVPLIRRTRRRAAEFTANVWTIAARHQAHVLDLWGTHTLYHPSLWSPDRIHLTAQGHERVTRQVMSLLGLSEDRSSWTTPLEPLPPRGRGQALREDVQWLRLHALPWISRHMRGRSSGDGLPPKRPDLEPMRAPAPAVVDLDRQDSSAPG